MAASCTSKSATMFSGLGGRPSAPLEVNNVRCLHEN